MIEQRRRFVRLALAEGANLSALCREFDITRKTGRQWRERARAEGTEAVQDRSRRPRHSPSRLSEEQLCRLVLLRCAWPQWGPKKLREIYRRRWGQTLSVSSCHRVLKACGLIAERRQRVRRPVSTVHAARVPQAPNDIWTVDFKGWWRLGNQQRCEPLTVRDAYSRFVLSAHVPASSKAVDLRPEFHRLFQTYGLPKLIKSDNGAPFASTVTPLGLSSLSAEWVALGIELEHSRPGHPEDNPAHERLHRDLQAEVSAHVQVDLVAQQAALDVWRKDYNEIRPHERLQQRTPAQLYCKSPRPYPGAGIILDYGPGYLPRLVTSDGYIRYCQERIFLTTAVAGWHVGLKLMQPEILEVWFHYLRLGQIDLKTNRFASAPSRSSKAVGLAA